MSFEHSVQNLWCWSKTQPESSLFVPSQWFFLFIFCWTKIPFVGLLIAPILAFVWPSPWVLKPGWVSCLHSCLCVCMVILRVMSGVTLAFSTNMVVHCNTRRPPVGVFMAKHALSHFPWYLLTSFLLIICVKKIYFKLSTNVKVFLKNVFILDVNEWKMAFLHDSQYNLLSK